MENEFEYGTPYWKWLERRLGDRSGPVETLQRRTMNTAMMILAKIRNIPFQQISASLYFYCKDMEMKKFAHLYEAQLELAGAAPEKFAKGLHKFYNEITLKIKKENLYREFLSFLALSTRMRLNSQNAAIHTEVINCYQILLLQNREYLRPNKFDLTTAVCGITTDGKLMTAKDTYPTLDRPTYEIERDVRNGRIRTTDELQDRIARCFAKAGLPEVKTLGELERLQGIDKLHLNQIVALLPMINEYTFDIVPVTPFTTIADDFFSIQVNSPSSEELKEKLNHRNRTLPTNGVIFQFEPGRLVKSVLMKEIFYNDSIHMLYRMETTEGDLSGYYDTQGRYFHCIFLDAANLEPYERVQNLLLYLYACAVTKEGGKLLQNLEYACGYAVSPSSALWIPMRAQMFGCGGKLKNVYDPTSEDAQGHCSRIGNEKYEYERKSIQGYIRKVGRGRTPSAAATEYGRSLGYDLEADETVDDGR